jgi:multidrug efflux pump subunit AcrA (membrane-fusion protein)
MTFGYQLEQQRKEMEQREQALRAEANAEKAALTAQAEQTLAAVSTKLAAMTAQVEALKEEARRAVSRHPLSGVLTEEQLLALQTRAQQLHEAQLLTDEENFTVEDIISDCIEVLATGSFVGDVVVSEVIKIVALSERIPSDMSFARQLRRKCRLSAA